MSVTVRTRSLIAVLAGAALFSTGGAAIKLCQFGPWQIAGWRSLLAGLVLFACGRALEVRSEKGQGPRRRSVFQWPSGREWWVALCYAVTVVLFVAANKWTTAASAVFLQATPSVHLVWLAPLVLRERLARRDLLVGAWLLLGILLIVLGAGEAQASATRPALGNSIAVLSGFAYALTLLGTRALHTREGGNPFAAIAWGNLLAFVLCAPSYVQLPGAASFTDVASVLFLGLFQLGLGYVLVIWGMRALLAFESSLLLLVEPMLGPLWAWWLLAERLSWLEVGGALVVLVGLIVKALFERVPGGQPVAPASA